MKAILLAGGKGTRLRPLTLHTPKPIVPIFNRPFLHYQLDLLKQVPEVNEVVLSLNYQPRRIEEVFGDGTDLGLRIRYMVEPQPLGTGGAIKFSAHGMDESVIVFNGDVLTAIDLGEVIARHRERNAKATIVLTPVDNPTAYGLVETDTFDRIPKDTNFSIERSYFPSLIERGETFVAYVYRGYWIDIGTPAKYRQVHRDIMSGHYPAIPFLGNTSAPVIAEGAKVEDGARVEGPCFIDHGATVKAGARVGPGSVIGRSVHVEEGAVVEDTIVWANSWIGRDAEVRGAILGRNVHLGRSVTVRPDAVLGDKTVVTDFSSV